MSSIVILQGSEGFVISADSIVLKYIPAPNGQVMGAVTGICKKLFQLHEDILVGAVGNWNSYLPLINQVAELGLPFEETLQELRTQGQQLSDVRLYLMYRQDEHVFLDIIEGNLVRINQTGAVIYPEPILNSLFMTLYESPAAMQIRMTGLLGIASLVTAFNNFALSLSSQVASPFDTILFLKKGMVILNGGVIKVPISNFM